MKGFFTGGEVKVSDLPTQARQGRRTASKRSSDPCEACGLHLECKTPRMPIDGKGKKGILVVGEGPGRTEDERGMPFIGESGDLLQKVLARYDIDLREDCWIGNAVFCRPPKNRTPTKKEVKCCSGRLWGHIRELKPRFIFLFGATAVDAIYQGRFPTESISRWRRICIPDPKANAWVIANYHPSYLIRNSTDKNLRATFDRDIAFAASCLKNNPPEFQDWRSKCIQLTNADSVISFLNNLLHLKSGWIAFDYETSGLQPYHAGMRIASCSIAPNPYESYAFPVSYPGAWEGDELAEIKHHLALVMGAGHLGKICHNVPFEEKWTRTILGTRINGERWCTMNAAHVLDARKDFTGLKFQTFINFGVEDYSREIDPFLKSRGSSPFNTVHKAPLAKLLEYNAADSLFTHQLFMKQRLILTRRSDPRGRAFAHCMRGVRALDNASERGWCADELYYAEVEDDLDKEIKKVEKRLLLGPEAKRFEEQVGRKLELASQDFSPADLRKMLFEVLGFKATKKTEKAELDATDADVLDGIDHPFAKAILRRRKLVKLKNTYVAGFSRAIINGRMHPTFNLHTTRTYRSSANDPNAQNIPVRDEEAKKYTRSGIKPSPGQRLLFADYGSIEVRILACYTQDQELVKYCNDPTTDMHRDEAMNIFILKKNQVSKALRQGAKNQFVFPEVYGSYWKNCARDLWNINMEEGKLADGTPLKDHLKGKLFKGFPTGKWQDVWANHIKRVEEKFWGKFHATREWQMRSLDEYLAKGCIDMLFGHRRGGYLTRNKIFNTPIQNTAFQCLLWSFYTLDDMWERKKLRSQLIGQIHDEIIVDEDPDEHDEVVRDVQSIMSEKIREEFDWLIVPLPVEFGLTKIDGSWYQKTSYEPGGPLPEDKA